MAREQNAPTGATLHDLVRKGKSFSGKERNCLFLNLGDGKFADVSSVSGFDFPDDGRAVAQSDWDLDGDLDFWVANRSGPQVRFLRNDLETAHHFLAIGLEGTTCNRDAIGARVEVALSNPNSELSRPKLIKTLRAGEGFLAQSSKWLHFGLGAATKIEQVVVRWPGGKVEEFDGMEVDHHYRLIQQSGKAQTWSATNRSQSIQPVALTKSKSTEQTRVVSAAQLPLPLLDYESFDGKIHSLQEVAKGRPLLVNLWASWCGPCLTELREMAERSADLRKAGVEVIALSVDRLDTENESDHTLAPGVLKRFGFTGKSGWASDATIEKLQLVNNHLFDLHQPLAVPTSLLINSAGNLVVIYRGPFSVDQLLADIAELPDVASSSSGLPFVGRWHAPRKRLSPHGLAWQLVKHGYHEENLDYIEKHRKLLKRHVDFPRLLALAGNGQVARGQVESGVSYYREALNIDADYGDAQNNLAWVLATHPDKSIRNGKEAVLLAEQAVEAKSGPSPGLLDTLAAAYAEDSQFAEAVSIAKQAIEQANASGQLKLAEGIEERLQLYEASRPFREK